MPYLNFSLPSYPLMRDMWDELALETRPIVIYGMGNGADKLLARMEKYNITPSDIFASDGFVRGHSFRGMRVLSFSEIKEKYEDFVIILSFASSRTEVLEMLCDIDKKYDMYVPDMPVAGEEEYFDREFYNDNYDKILSAYNSLADEISKNAYAAIVNYKLSGRMSYLESAYSEKDELYSCLPCDSIHSMLDLGAYNGDTLREGIEYFPHLSEAVLVEPDPKNYKRLMKYLDSGVGIQTKAINACALDRVGEVFFASSGNRNSTATATASYKNKESEIPSITADSLERPFDYIKYDVEGAEMAALLGTHGTIEKYRPTLLVSLYHRSRDLFEIVNYLTRYEEYDLFLRRLRCVPAWEIDLILIPKDKRND